MKRLLILFSVIILGSCDEESPELDDTMPIVEEPAPEKPELYVLPVVIHVLHLGEEEGHGTNLSLDRIERQIEILNEDFRRKAGTRGFNDFDFGGDTRIEFALARQDPDGQPTTGINRTKVDLASVPDHVPNTEVDRMGFFSYWDPEQYINVWTAPYGESIANLHLGSATGPDSDLLGDEFFLKPLPGGAEGIVINCWHFGESDVEGVYNLGRTLTHEMGHYLGLLHTWGVGDCEFNDYCDDTPPVSMPVTSSSTYLGCTGEDVQIQNYMNWTPDAVMNVFTKDQITRMRYVLENSPRRTTLLTSKGIQSP